ncbi:MAG: hypothetical protein J6W96_01340 [Alphaproteobacteria bacterium]|nr:hypothetical protein [Alphaproteobacteria bacterium]
MGGRGSYASGNRTYEYETVGTIEGVKVVRRISGSNKVPEESYTSKAYVQFDKDGDVKRYREFKDDHTPKFDIDYQREPSVNKSEKSYHIHYYGSQYKNGRSGAIPISEKELSKYIKFFDKKAFKEIK